MTEQTSFQDTKKANFKEHKNCRVCGSTDLTMYMDYGLMPLPNNLEISNTQAISKERYPLQVMFCEECSLSQLSIVVDPKEMFSYYTYRSSINAGYIKHAKEMAYRLKNKYHLDEESFVIDIAGNDGALLKQFKEAIECKVLNVDPAKNLCKIAQGDGVDCIADFWSPDVALDILNIHGQADIITATNVFAHVDNVKDFMLCALDVLKDRGVLVLEFPYIIDFIEGMEMDTVYFEHLSYFSILPLMRLCADTHMKIISVEKFKIHGGTVRVSIAKAESFIEIEQSVWDFVKAEMNGGYGSIKKYKLWAKNSLEVIQSFRNGLLSLHEKGFDFRKIWAFAASAKGNTLLNSAKIDSTIVGFILDETPEKQYRYSPGNGIMIKGMGMLGEDLPDYIVILSWNFAEEIMKKLRKRGYEGKFIIPIPEFKIID